MVDLDKIDHPMQVQNLQQQQMSVKAKVKLASFLCLHLHYSTTDPWKKMKKNCWRNDKQIYSTTNTNFEHIDGDLSLSGFMTESLRVWEHISVFSFILLHFEH